MKKGRWSVDPQMSLLNFFKEIGDLLLKEPERRIHKAQKMFLKKAE